MYKLFCDLCGKPIESNAWDKYKIKKYNGIFETATWDKLDVHTKCWNDMCEYIKSKRDIDEDK